MESNWNKYKQLNAQTKMLEEGITPELEPETYWLTIETLEHLYSVMKDIRKDLVVKKRQWK